MTTYTKTACRVGCQLLLVIALISCADPSATTTTAGADTVGAGASVAPAPTQSSSQLPSLGQDNPWGPVLGSQLVELQAADQGGRVRSLADLTGRNGLLLMLVRSADW